MAIAKSKTTKGMSTAIARLSLRLLSPTRSVTSCQPGAIPGGRRKLHCHTFSDRRESCTYGTPYPPISGFTSSRTICGESDSNQQEIYSSGPADLKLIPALLALIAFSNRTGAEACGGGGSHLR